nr:putative reverse transcriptase domain-containing protein [Tanacetum cinerariifolium]
MEDGVAVTENLVKKLGNAEEEAECKKLKRELEESSGQDKRTENNASGSGQARGQVTAPVVQECSFAGFMKCNPNNYYVTKGVVKLRRWFEKTEMTFGISECAEAKKVKFAAATIGQDKRTENNASGSGQARGQVTAPVVQECSFAGFMKCNPNNYYVTKGVVKLRRWFEKTEMTFGISECAEAKKVKFAAATM